MTIQLYRGAGVPETVRLADLISLIDAGFEDADQCTRDIDQEHVMQFALAGMENWPALKVVGIGPGLQKYAVIDGNHRWEAAKILKAEQISVIAGNYDSEAEVIDAAFKANLTNGRAASTEVRSKYALWLFWQDPSDKPNLSAIARKVGLHPSVVNRAVNKELKRLEAEEEAEARGSSVTEITETDRLLKAIRRYMENETAFFAGPDGERSVKKRATALVRHLNSMSDKGKAARAAKDLQSLYQSLIDVFSDQGQQRRKNA